MAELFLIDGIRRRALQGVSRSAAVRLGIGDDCAVLRPPAGHDLLLTTDFSLEGRHFRRAVHPPESVGHRCLARGMSDLAAMGASPLAAFLSLALPPGFTRRAAGRQWVDGFLAGLMQLADQLRTPLAGGDTASAGGDLIAADIVLVGAAPRGQEIRRSGARPGDRIFVTGALGGAAAELDRLLAKPRRFRGAVAGDAAANPHLFPAPRVAMGVRLRRIASAAIDVSDGLATDLRHLCSESRVGAVVWAEALPLHPLLNAMPRDRAIDLALRGGEDYELLFTASPGMRVPTRIAGMPVTEIGEIRAARKLQMREDGRMSELPAGGWEHDV